VHKTPLILIAFVALALAGGSSASSNGTRLGVPFIVGASEDQTLGYDDGGAILYDEMTTHGLGAIRMSVDYEPNAPTTIQQREQLERAIGSAIDRGVRVLLSISPGHAADVAGDKNGTKKFAAYTALVARAFPGVTDFIIGNEPNLGNFWAPTYSAKGAILSGASYEAALAASYDALKAVNADIDVVGLAVSSHGDDRPGSARNTISPVRFIKAVGDAYRASKRSRPIMDNAALHPYPNPNTDPPDKGLLWPNVGIPNLDRAQQAFWDAFHGTAQPTFDEPGTRTSQSSAPVVQWVLDEAGWQTDTKGLPGYTGAENTPPVDEATQARYYKAVVQRYGCDSHVAALLFFHWIDESARDRLQSGMVRADNTMKPSANAVKSAIAGGCTGTEVRWRHSLKVDGATTNWKPKAGFLFFVKSFEEATFVATATPTKSAVKQAKKLKLTLKKLTVKGRVKAYVGTGVKFKGVTLKNATSYTYGVKIAAAMNAKRTVTLKTKKLQKPNIEL
jgi:hypothetical protein